MCGALRTDADVPTEPKGTRPELPIRSRNISARSGAGGSVLGLKLAGNGVVDGRLVVARDAYDRRP